MRFISSAAILTCDVPLMVSVPLCGTGSIWIPDSGHCTFSVANVVTA